jgi:hypothetical protein
VFCERKEFVYVNIVSEMKKKGICDLCKWKRINQSFVYKGIIVLSNFADCVNASPTLAVYSWFISWELCQVPMSDPRIGGGVRETG